MSLMPCQIRTGGLCPRHLFVIFVFTLDNVVELEQPSAFVPCEFISVISKVNLKPELLRFDLKFDRGNSGFATMHLDHL